RAGERNPRLACDGLRLPDRRSLFLSIPPCAVRVRKSLRSDRRNFQIRELERLRPASSRPEFVADDLRESAAGKRSDLAVGSRSLSRRGVARTLRLRSDNRAPGVSLSG